MADSIVEFYGTSNQVKREPQKKDPFNHLVDVFGPDAGVQKDYDCFKNAIQNAVLSIIDGKNNPTIFDVQTSVGRHAYLSLGHTARSKGYTWSNNFYPELSLQQIDSLHGKDVTVDLLAQSLDPETDTHGYHRVLDKLEKKFPDVQEKVKNYIEENKK